jgi:GNAT superfamily N-acetyltransferase
MHSVYELQHNEYNRYRKHLLALDSASRYMRFGYAANDAMINIICDRFDQDKSKHKIFVIEDEDLNVIAVGHIAIDRDTELAFSVLKEYQSQGMGSALMKRCVEWCQNRSIKQGCMVCLSSNAAIKKLAHRHGILVEQDGEAMADIQIPDISTVSVISEITDSNVARIDHLGKIQRKFARMFTYPLQFNQ